MLNLLVDIFATSSTIKLNKKEMHCHEKNTHSLSKMSSFILHKQMSSSLRSCSVSINCCKVLVCQLSPVRTLQIPAVKITGPFGKCVH